MPPILAQTSVFAEYNSSIPNDVSAPLRAHIAGPEAELHRYSVPAEKSIINLGAYNPAGNVTYNWPGKSSLGLVDLTYTKVFIDNALLRYFQDLIGSGTTIAPVANYKNRISTNGANGFAANGVSFPRITGLKDRDVELGDIVLIQDGSNNSLQTYVAGLIADTVAASIGTATADANNAPAQPSSNPGANPTISPTGGGATGGSLAAGTYFVRYTFVGPFGETSASAGVSFTIGATNIPRVTIPALPTGATSANIYLSPVGGTAAQCTLYATGIVAVTADLVAVYTAGGAAAPLNISQIAGTVNDVLASAVDVSTYNGSATGDLTETYTITVTTLGAPGTGKLQVTSASGRDDASNVTIAAYGSPTTIGTRGLTVTWAHTSNDFVVGQTWQLTVRQAWTPVTLTSAGTYLGQTTQTYIVQVSRGGLFSDSTKPQISVTTDHGTDSSGPTTVTASAAAITIGTLGVTLAFTGNGLRKGNIYYVPVLAPTTGAYRTLVLGNNMSSALIAAGDLSLTLYIQKSVQIPQQRLSSPPNLNWTELANTITINSGIDAYDPTLTNGGVPFSAPILGGTLYVEYRAWIPTHTEQLLSVSTETEVNTMFGHTYLSPDNPLAYGVYKAVQNGNAQPVYFTGIADPTNLANWTDMLTILEGYNNLFSLVPLSRDTNVWALYQTHVNARTETSDIHGEWRMAWFNLQAVDTQVVIDTTSTSDSLVALATVGDNPNAGGTQYTLLTCTSGNAKFVTNGVLPGDVVRYLFSIDAFGNLAYQQFIVASVVNEDSLLFTVGNSVAITTPQKVEVWRNLSKHQVAEGLAAQIETGGNLNKRFRFVWPDQLVDDNNLIVAGYFLCAAYAGFVGGIAPQQGLRNVQIKGFIDTPRSVVYFNNSQLNVLGTAGAFVVTVAPTGEVYAKFARTPDLSSVAHQEEMVTRLDDAIRYLFYNRAAKFFGKANVTPTAMAILDSELKAAIQHGVSDTRVDRIGPMLLSGNVDTIYPSTTMPDQVIGSITVSRPYPLNDANFVLTF